MAPYGGPQLAPLQGDAPMEPNVDQGRSVQDASASSEPSHLDSAVDGAGSLVAPRTRLYSFWAECECPYDCLRDHANE
jgi:hypothetical protein